MTTRHIPHVVIALVFSLSAICVHAQEPATVYLSADSLNEGRALHDVTWRFHAGDNPAWADPAYDASDWQLVRPDFPGDSLEAIGWTGIPEREKRTHEDTA